MSAASATSPISPIDWAVLIASLVFVVVYGMWRTRRNQSLDGFLLADRDARWYTVLLSIMATQASAITFLSTPGQAYADGMRFVQFYFGLPLAMVVLSITAVPIFHRLKVYTAYEYLETRFGRPTRTLAATLFLVQRGLACGLTIYAPALILRVLLGWNLHLMIFLLGTLVVVYTASGGTRAVNETNVQQMIIILVGMAAAFVAVVMLLPSSISLFEAAHVAGKLGKLDAIDFTFDLTDRYNLWSGLIGGFFLAMSYFGTDQSQVARYLSGRSVAQSRLGLLANGIVKIPMQFFILLVGAMVFVFYQFVTPPLFFDRQAVAAVEAGPHAAEYAALEDRHVQAAQAKRAELERMVTALRADDDTAVRAAQARAIAAQEQSGVIRSSAVDLIKRAVPDSDGKDNNYVFLTFVLRYLPVGLVGVILAAIFAASMSSTSAELNALASTSVIDLYKRSVRKDASDAHYVTASKLATVVWGGFAILFAETASLAGRTLVEAVNVLGSLFYGTILGIFLVAFYMKRVGGRETFVAALVAEAVVLACFTANPLRGALELPAPIESLLARIGSLGFLWYNVVGCVLVMGLAAALTAMRRTSLPGLPGGSESR